MAINSVVRLDKVKSVYGGHLYSVETTEAMQNGFVAAVKGLKAGEREIHEIEKAGTDKEIVLIAEPAIVYDNARMGSNSEQNFSIESGDVVRAYEITKGDIFSVTVEGLDLLGAEPVVDNYVVADAADFKLHEIATLAGTEAFVARIARVDVVGTPLAFGQPGVNHRQLKYVVLEVVKNG